MALLITCHGLLHARAYGGEGGGDVVEGLVKGSAIMSDGEGTRLHSSQIFLEGRDHMGVFDRFLRDLVVAAEVFAEADLN